MEKFATDIDTSSARGRTGFTSVVLTTGGAMVEMRANEDDVGMAPETTPERRHVFETVRSAPAADAVAWMTIHPL